MDLEECYRKGMIKKARIEKELISSLLEMSQIKQLTVETAQINEINISAYVSLAYDSLLAVLEALCNSRGYKVLSHICIGELLQELLEKFDYHSFDRLRWIRNSINYYGQKVDFEQGKEIIQRCFELKKEIKEKYLKGT